MMTRHNPEQIVPQFAYAQNNRLGQFVSIPVQKQSRNQFQLSPKPVHNPFQVSV